MTDSLQAVFQPLVSALNRQIRSTTPARELCRQLHDSVFALRVRNTALALYVEVGAEEIHLATASTRKPDVVLCGSLLSLLRLAGAQGENVIREGDVELTGNALLAQDFRKLLSMARPDPEEELSRYIGDVAAHEMGRFARSALRWARDTRQTMVQNVGEYLQEERRAVPSRYEVNRFRDGVHALRDDLARMDARLKQLENAAGGTESGSA